MFSLEKGETIHAKVPGLGLRLRNFWIFEVEWTKKKLDPLLLTITRTTWGEGQTKTQQSINHAILHAQFDFFLPPCQDPEGERPHVRANECN